ncbi:MAG: plasmid pRiA4b ORF-3 family protein [Acidobacteria bacterium]|nr:plasmid pRiA4b ORF-3 family protein [Acidobacteriota bacterium]
MTKNQPRKKAVPSVLQLKITLRGSKPPIWRRVQVLNNMTFADLHDVIQIVMRWTYSHLHQFVVANEFIGSVAELEDDVLDEARIKLSDYISGEKGKFRYEYDFGDRWDHTIEVEKILPVDPNQSYPRCIAGKRACPPEDCGGIWGYANLLEILADPNNPEHETMRVWVGDEFDPNEFDLKAVAQVFGGQDQ